MTGASTTATLLRKTGQREGEPVTTLTFADKLGARIESSDRRKWWTLGAVAFALFMIMLDNTVVNVALPSIERGLGAGLSELEWVLNAYVLCFAVLMLMGGKLADLFGRRRIFLIGLIVFTGMSLACGLATSAGELIAFRAIQGAGAALMLPATLAIITAAFPPRQRGTALGIWAGVSAMALAIGPLIGGVLTEHISWSWIFFVNVPIGVVGVLVGLVVIAETRDTTVGQRLDIPGLVASGAALFALTFALIEANNYGWTSPAILGLFAGAAAAFAVFLLLERRPGPMLDLSLFRNGTFSGANIVALLVTLAMFGVFFFMSLYVQRILGYSPVQAGAIFLPMTLLIVVVAPISGRLSDRVGSRWLMAGGLALLGVALILFSRLGTGSDFWSLLPGLILAGVGIASTMSPMTAAAMRSVPVTSAGVASGVLSTFRQVGGAMGIAIMGAILTSRETSALARGASGPQAFIDGFSRALVVAAIIAFVGAFTAGILIRRTQAPEAIAEPSPGLAPPTGAATSGGR
jgi:EmrB/QacA subfamily drug resistance transporter